MQNRILILASVLVIICSNCIAQTWTQIPSGTTKNLKAISFPTSSVGYIGGQDSLLLKTTNGGETWTQINYAGVTFYPNGHDIIELKFVSELVGYMLVGPYSGMYKTLDGGLTWTFVDGIYACFNTSLYFFDENNGFLGGSGCFSGEIINKLDGTWQETNIIPTFIQQGGQITNFDFYDSNLGLASSSGSYVFKTTDGGNNWDTIPNNLTEDEIMTSILYLNEDTILATYNSSSSGTFGVNVSFDGGLTWQLETNSATFFYPNMYASEKSGNGWIFIGGESSLTSGGINPGLIYVSNGSISNWTYESVNEPIRDIDSYGDSVVFAVGQNGYIVVNQDLSQLGIESNDEEFEFDVYPNPNQGEFTISVGENRIEEIEICDLLGKVVYRSTSVFSNELIDISSVSKGVYVIQLNFGDRKVSKRIIVD